MRLKGWVNYKRELGGIIFIEMLSENSLEPVTVVIKKKENVQAWNIARSIKLGSAILVEGTYPPKSMSKRGREFRAEKIEIMSKPEAPLPVDPSLKTSMHFDTRLRYRYLLLRTKEERALFKIRAEVLKTAREFLERKGFLEVNTPKICGAGAEGGATVFELKYFGRRAFLAQSPQLYKQMLMAGLTKVYEITPYFRAEKHHTTRHLNESWAIDLEMGFISGMEEVMNLLEELVCHILKEIRKRSEEELEILGVEITIPRRPFARLEYSEVLEMLEEEGVHLEWGEDLGDTEERALGKIMKNRGYDMYFITHYPWRVKQFYIMREGELSRSFDLDYRGLEISSGGQREHRYEELVRNIREKGLNPIDFEFYLEAFKYGMPPHGGCGVGVERLLMKMLNIENIRETILFPRDIQRLIP